MPNKRIMSGTKKLGLVRTSPIIAKHFVPHMRALDFLRDRELNIITWTRRQNERRV